MITYHSRIFLSLITAIFLISGLAQMAPADAALTGGWAVKARQLFEQDEYERVIRIAKPHRKSTTGKLFLAFSYLQHGIYTNSKVNKKRSKDYIDILKEGVSLRFFDDVAFFTNQRDKPSVVKAARKLLTQAFKNIDNVSDVPQVLKFLRSPDPKIQQLASKTCTRVLKPLRTVVTKGGTLRKKDIQIMRSPRVIRALLSTIDTAKTTNCLKLIEEPVLKYTSRYSDNPLVVKLEQKINGLVQKRQKKYPDSNWYSAIGKQR